MYCVATMGCLDTDCGSDLISCLVSVSLKDKSHKKKRNMNGENGCVYRGWFQLYNRCRPTLQMKQEKKKINESMNCMLFFCFSWFHAL